MPPLPPSLPGSSAQMVWQHLPMQFQKQKCKGWARWDREISVQERALGGCHYEWFLQQSLRINLTSVLGQVSGKQTIWDAIWLGVLSETMPVREGRRQEGAERGAEVSCSLNKELNLFLWGFSWAAGPCRVSVLWSRESVLYTHTGPDLVLGLPLERENQLSQVTSGKEHACQCRRHKRCRFNPSLGREDPLEEDMAIHCNIVTWRIP